MLTILVVAKMIGRRSWAIRVYQNPTHTDKQLSVETQYPICRKKSIYGFLFQSLILVILIYVTILEL